LATAGGNPDTCLDVKFKINLTSFQPSILAFFCDSQIGSYYITLHRGITSPILSISASVQCTDL